MATPFEIGARIRDAKKMTHGFVRYVGPVCSDKKQPDRVWIGVEWDDVTRGKHDGSAVDAAGATVRYYTCAQGAGSFVKPRTVTGASSITDALRNRYEPHDGLTGSSHILGSASTSSGQEIKIELVGTDKIRERQKLVDLTTATLVETTAGNAGETGELKRCCPNLVALDLDHTLVTSWSDVVTGIGAELALHTLRLGRNPLSGLEKIAPGAVAAAFPALRILSLNGTRTSWPTVRRLLVELPVLTELYLAGNAIGTLGFAEIMGHGDGAGDATLDATRGAARAGLERLEVLDLAGNGIASWAADGLLELATLPRLETLVLDGNALCDFDGVYDAAAPEEATAARFSALRCLALNDNAFASWETLDALDHLPALTDLRLLRNPITRESGPRRSRQTLIARIAKLQRLNNSEVRVRERREVEQLYLKQLLTKVYEAAGAGGITGEGAAAAEAVRVAARASHPRFDALMALHPEIASMIAATAARARKAGAAGSGLGRNVVKIELGSSAVESMAMPLKTKRLLRSMKITNVKVLCAKLFKLDVSKQRLYLHERSHPLPIELDDDERDLDYFGVQDGGKIMMHSIDDDGRGKEKEKGEEVPES